MIDGVFLANDIAAGPSILGLRLYPFSIWHSWALKAMESPFVCGGDFDIESFCDSILICTLRKEDHDAIIRSSHLAVYKGGQIAPAILSASQEEREEAVIQFIEYIQDCTEFPDFWEGSDLDPIKDRIRCPTEWHLVAALLRMRICQTESEAWNYPAARAHCWLAVEGERKGSKSYVDPRDRADIKKAEGLKDG